MTCKSKLGVVHSCKCNQTICAGYEAVTNTVIVLVMCRIHSGWGAGQAQGYCSITPPRPSLFHHACSALKARPVPSTSLSTCRPSPALTCTRSQTCSLAAADLPTPNPQYSKPSLLHHALSALPQHSRVSVAKHAHWQQADERSLDNGALKHALAKPWLRSPILRVTTVVLAPSHRGGQTEGMEVGKHRACMWAYRRRGGGQT